ncbi:uncharacterized protein MELLADRAFT_117111 [Melampsora larici-populina 98AG31]|uniref:Uncharacterized protein n=1 Tax=Melampsora larici-populina (strain 98AG31 / pathotype 3-4-7) TaxID=747676 RepID=F4RTE5_MELLP|nr:uncharacterized protein MELLADRAFT_117111 [Melampsora larici-populina 98AG31]EGG04243.1 hypothetical protein MELLADRAFT_117111 [Melampsora larici-populina 98AG31]
MSSELKTSQTTTNPTDLLNSIQNVLTETFRILIREVPPLQSQREALVGMYADAAQLAENEPGESVYEAELLEKSHRLKESDRQFQALLVRLVEPLSKTMIQLSTGYQADHSLRCQVDQLHQTIIKQSSRLDFQEKQIKGYENGMKETKEKMNTQIAKVESDFHLIQTLQDERIKEMMKKGDLSDQNRVEHDEKISKQLNNNLQSLKDFESKTSRVIQENKEFEGKLNKVSDEDKKGRKALEKKLMIKIEGCEKDFKEFVGKSDDRNGLLDQSLKGLESKLEGRCKSLESQSGNSLKELEEKMNNSIKAYDTRFQELESKLKKQGLGQKHQELQYLKLQKTMQVYEESSKSLNERVEGLKEMDDRLAMKIKEDERKDVQINQTYASHQASLERITQLTITVQETSQSLKDLQSEISKKEQLNEQTKVIEIQEVCQEVLVPCLDRVSKLENSFGKLKEAQQEEQRLQASSKVRADEPNTLRKDSSQPIEEVSMRAPNEETRRQDSGVNSSRVPSTPALQPSDPSHPSTIPSNAGNPTTPIDHPARPSSLTSRHPSLVPNAHKSSAPNPTLRVDTTLKAATVNHLRTTHVSSPTPVESGVNNTGFSLHQLEGLYSYLSHRLMNSNWLSEMIKTKVGENEVNQEVLEKMRKVMKFVNSLKVDEDLIIKKRKQKEDGTEDLELMKKNDLPLVGCEHLMEIQNLWTRSKVLEQKISEVDLRCTEIISKEVKQNLSKTDVGVVQPGTTTFDKNLENRILKIVETMVKETVAHQLTKVDLSNEPNLNSSNSMKPIQEILKRNPSLPIHILRSFESHIVERMINLSGEEAWKTYEGLIKDEEAREEGFEGWEFAEGEEEEGIGGRVGFE